MTNLRDHSVVLRHLLPGKLNRIGASARHDRHHRPEFLESRIAPATAFAITSTGNLARFDLDTPGTIISSLPISGLAGGESVLGIDFRPATGELYALGSTSRLYILDYMDDAASVVATAVGNAGAFTLSGTSFGFDFNPTVDRIRVVSDTDQNLRLNPNDGTLAATDTALGYAAADVNAGANPIVGGSAYTNNVAGATTTTLYGIDVGRSPDVLVTQNPPNAGVLNTVGSLGVNATSVLGFDIRFQGVTNTAYATMVVGGISSLYTINLATGAATLVGAIGGGLTLRGLAIAPEGFGNTTLVGTTATFNGGAASETIEFDQAGGLLRHNRFTAGDPGFASDFDFNPNVAGDQTLTASDPAVTVVVNAGGGDDRVTIGSATAPASSLAVAFQINGQGGGDSLTINDVADVTARVAIINGVTSTIGGVGGLKSYGALELVTFNAGSGADSIIVLGTTAAATNINAGGGSDTIAFGDGASLRGGFVDGGTGINTLDYSSYTTPVTVDLSAAATQTLFQGILSGAQEPGPLSNSGASGMLVGTLNAAQTAFDFSISYQGLSGSPISGMHFHNQNAGVNGPIVRGLFASEQHGLVTPSGSAAGVWSASDPTLNPPDSDAPIRPLTALSPVTPGSTLTQELLAGRIYFNLHTLPNFPSGEIRGQIISQGFFNPATGTAGTRNFNDVTGGSGDDTLVGNNNVNLIRGGPGADIITGGVGGDQLHGEGDADLMIWNNGDGSDFMEGGAGNDIVQVNGSTTGGDQFLLQVNPADAARLRFDRTNLGLFNLNIGTTEALDFNTLGGDDTVTIDFAGGNPIPANGVDFDGGTGDEDANADRLVLQRSAGAFNATTEIYTSTGPHSGSISVDGKVITFSNLAPVDDTLPATTFTFIAPAGAQKIQVSDGPILGGFATMKVASRAGAFELIDLANKANVTINTSSQLDRVTINNPTAPAGITSLTVNLGSGDDRFELVAAAIPTVTLNGSDGADLFFVAGQANTIISIDGGNPNTAPGDVLQYHHPAGDAPTIDASSITRPGVQPVNYAGIEEVLTSTATVSGLQQLNPKTIVYRDVDGDIVQIKANRPLDISDFVGIGNTVDGTQIELIDFASDTALSNVNLTITAKRDPVLGGDSFVNIGFLNAPDITLGVVKLNGDLGRIVVGTDAATIAVKSLNVQSIGLFGTDTQDFNSGATNASVVTGTIKTLGVLGSVTGASISAARFGTIKIGGDLVDSSLRAQGLVNPASNSVALAIKSLSVTGSVVGTQVLAGYDALGLAANSDVQIGSLLVGENWIASDLVAGVQPGADGLFGTADDALITAIPGNEIVARIASIRIRGVIVGETAGTTGAFGFVAEEIAKFQVGTARLALKLKPGNDNLSATDPLYSFGPNRDVTVHEVAG